MGAAEVLNRDANGERNFQDANLQGQNFRNQDLSGADFSRADIRGTNFRGENLAKSPSDFGVMRNLWHGPPKSPILGDFEVE